METRNLEIRANIKFLTKLGWKSSQVMDSLHQVYKDYVPHRTTIFRCIKRFKEGQDDLKDDSREGRPSTSTSHENIKAVQELVEKDRRITIDEIATILEISHGSAFLILRDHLGLSKLSARWAPKAFQKDQLVQRAEFSMSLLSKIEAIDNDYMERIVTVDETCNYQYDSESKMQSMQWLPKGHCVDCIGPLKA